jgi:hypothetical protein
MSANIKQAVALKRTQLLLLAQLREERHQAKVAQALQKQLEDTMLIEQSKRKAEAVRLAELEHQRMLEEARAKELEHQRMLEEARAKELEHQRMLEEAQRYLEAHLRDVQEAASLAAAVETKLQQQRPEVVQDEEDLHLEAQARALDEEVALLDEKAAREEEHERERKAKAQAKARRDKSIQSIFNIRTTQGHPTNYPADALLILAKSIGLDVEHLDQVGGEGDEGSVTDTELKDQDSELKDQDSELKDQDSELKDQDSELKDQDSELDMTNNVASLTLNSPSPPADLAQLPEDLYTTELLSELDSVISSSESSSETDCDDEEYVPTHQRKKVKASKPRAASKPRRVLAQLVPRQFDRTKTIPLSSVMQAYCRKIKAQGRRRQVIIKVQGPCRSGKTVQCLLRAHALLVMGLVKRIIILYGNSCTTWSKEKMAAALEWLKDDAVYVTVMHVGQFHKLASWANLEDTVIIVDEAEVGTAPPLKKSRRSCSDAHTDPEEDEGSPSDKRAKDQQLYTRLKEAGFLNAGWMRERSNFLILCSATMASLSVELDELGDKFVESVLVRTPEDATSLEGFLLAHPSMRQDCPGFLNHTSCLVASGETGSTLFQTWLEMTSEERCRQHFKILAERCSMTRGYDMIRFGDDSSEKSYLLSDRKESKEEVTDPKDEDATDPNFDLVVSVVKQDARDRGVAPDTAVIMMDSRTCSLCADCVSAARRGLDVAEVNTDVCTCIPLPRNLRMDPAEAVVKLRLWKRRLFGSLKDLISTLGDRHHRVRRIQEILPRIHVPDDCVDKVVIGMHGFYRRSEHIYTDHVRSFWERWSPKHSTVVEAVCRLLSKDPDRRTDVFYRGPMAPLWAHVEVEKADYKYQEADYWDVQLICNKERNYSVLRQHSIFGQEVFKLGDQNSVAQADKRRKSNQHAHTKRLRLGKVINAMEPTKVEQRSTTVDLIVERLRSNCALVTRRECPSLNSDMLFIDVTNHLDKYHQMSARAFATVNRTLNEVGGRVGLQSTERVNPFASPPLVKVIRMLDSWMQLLRDGDLEGAASTICLAIQHELELHDVTDFPGEEDVLHAVKMMCPTGRTLGDKYIRTKFSTGLRSGHQVPARAEVGEVFVIRDPHSKAKLLGHHNRTVALVFQGDGGTMEEPLHERLYPRVDGASFRVWLGWDSDSDSDGSPSVIVQCRRASRSVLPVLRDVVFEQDKLRASLPLCTVDARVIYVVDRGAVVDAPSEPPTSSSMSVIDDNTDKASDTLRMVRHANDQLAGERNFLLSYVDFPCLLRDFNDRDGGGAEIAVVPYPEGVDHGEACRLAAQLLRDVNGGNYQPPDLVKPGAVVCKLFRGKVARAASLQEVLLQLRIRWGSPGSKDGDNRPRAYYCYDERTRFNGTPITEVARQLNGYAGPFSRSRLCLMVQKGHVMHETSSAS